MNIWIFFYYIIIIGLLVSFILRQRIYSHINLIYGQSLSRLCNKYDCTYISMEWDLLTKVCRFALSACLYWTFFRSACYITDQTIDRQVSQKQTGAMFIGLSELTKHKLYLIIRLETYGSHSSTSYGLSVVLFCYQLLFL